MAAIEYTRRVVEVKYPVIAFVGDEWSDAIEYAADEVMLTAEARRTCGAPPLRVGQLGVVFLAYSGYVAGVKTAIQLTDDEGGETLALDLYDPLTGAHVDSWSIISMGEEEESPVHGRLLAFQGYDDDMPMYVVSTPAGLYRFAVTYTPPMTMMAPPFPTTIFSGWIEIEPAIPGAT
ncbi:MAG: hypothetical protein RBU35_20635 [Anaerolineae bacterium]|jgi:hypothetical protein|nr:hypothetical protein [Anaerolineae bacterium]